MSEAPSPDWFDRLVAAGAALPEAPGRSVRVEIGTTDTRSGASPHHVVFVDGRIGGAGPGLLDDAGLTVLLAGGDVGPFWRGELDLGVAFMQGRAKVVGPTSRLIDLLLVLRSGAWVELLASLPSLDR